MSNNTMVFSINQDLGNEGTRICQMSHEYTMTIVPGGCVLKPLPIHNPAASIYESFTSKYEQIRSAYGETGEFSYLCFIVNSRTRLVQSKVIRLEPGVFQDLIVGRHTRCHLVLREDETVSLRHALLRLYLRPADLVPVFKVLDLATPTALITVDGEKTSGLVGTGHCMLTVGEYHLYLIYNNDDALPTKAQEAWDSLQPAQPPERRENAFQTFDDLVSPAQIKPRRREVKVEAPERNENHTFSGTGSLFRVQGPSYIEDHSPGPEGTRVFLLVRSNATELDLRIAVKDSQLRRGVLIGRYSRCEIGGRHLEFPNSVSRVHLILMEDEGVYWAIDAASTYGNTVHTVTFSTRRMEGKTEIRLGEDTTLTWIPASEETLAGA
jgi:hypothetical protein